MLPDIKCTCGADMVADRSTVDTLERLPSGVPHSRITSLPADVWQWACICCGREECVVRGPSGVAQWSRVWPKGKWCEVATP